MSLGVRHIAPSLNSCGLRGANAAAGGALTPVVRRSSCPGASSARALDLLQPPSTPRRRRSPRFHGLHLSAQGPQLSKLSQSDSRVLFSSFFGFLCSDRKEAELRLCPSDATARSAPSSRCYANHNQQMDSPLKDDGHL